MRHTRLILISAALAAFASANATLLTFDITGSGDHSNMSQGYGDNVTATTMGNFHYGVGAEGYTPDVTAAYVGSDPALWTTGYGNLTNILMADDDNSNTSGHLQIILTAAAGFNVALHGFDMASYVSGGQTINYVRVLVDGNEAARSNNFHVTGTTHDHFAPVTSWVGQQITIELDANNLGGAADDVGFDNILISQQVQAVPEPFTMTLGIAGAGLFIRRRLKKA